MPMLEAQIYSPRWGHDDTYSLDLTQEQLVIRMHAREARCVWREGRDPSWEGEPLEDILRNDSIYPPAIFGQLLEHLWKSWRNGELTPERANEELQEVVGWLNSVTKSKPRTVFWKQYF